MKMKAKRVQHHSDCLSESRLVNGICPACKFAPDMQSIFLKHYCPECDVPLKEMKCPKCNKTFEKVG